MQNVMSMLLWLNRPLGAKCVLLQPALFVLQPKTELIADGCTHKERFQTKIKTHSTRLGAHPSQPRTSTQCEGTLWSTQQGQLRGTHVQMRHWTHSRINSTYCCCPTLS